jgi:hypothetical protein
MLKLACDVDTVPKQLFSLLTMQLIHWYTDRHLFEDLVSNALLKSILAGLCDADNTALRDFCAECASEFFKYALKHVIEDQKLRTRTPIMAFLLRLRAMALHPSAFQRTGAALGFSHIKRAFREEKVLVDVYALDLAFAFFRGLQLADGDDPGLGTVDKLKSILDALLKIIKKHTQQVRQCDSMRCARFHVSLL